MGADRPTRQSSGRTKALTAGRKTIQRMMTSRKTERSTYPSIRVPARRRIINGMSNVIGLRAVSCGDLAGCPPLKGNNNLSIVTEAVRRMAG